jgi:hypothetical protein
MDLRELGWGGMDWIDLAQDRDQRRALVITGMNFRVPYNFGNFISSCTTCCFPRGTRLHGVSYEKFNKYLNMNECLFVNYEHEPGTELYYEDIFHLAPYIMNKRFIGLR